MLRVYVRCVCVIIFVHTLCDGAKCVAAIICISLDFHLRGEIEASSSLVVVVLHTVPSDCKFFFSAMYIIGEFLSGCRQP